MEDIKGDSLLHVALCMHHNLCYGDEKLPRIANVSSKTAVYAPRISQVRSGERGRGREGKGHGGEG